MNCPNCGKQRTSDQRFCRSCGASVGSELQLRDHVPEPGISQAGRIRRLGLLSMFAGLGIAVTGSMLLHLDLVVYVGVLMNFLGMFLIVYPSVVPPRRRKAASFPSPQPEVLTPAETTKKLTPMNDNYIDVIPSVTEGTTELLKTPVSKPATSGQNRER